MICNETDSISFYSQASNFNSMALVQRCTSNSSSIIIETWVQVYFYNKLFIKSESMGCFPLEWSYQGIKNAILLLRNAPRNMECNIEMKGLRFNAWKWSAFEIVFFIRHLRWYSNLIWNCINEYKSISDN